MGLDGEDDNMGLSILSDGCQIPAYLDVQVGLSTPSGVAAIWDDALWDEGTWGPDVVWEPVSDYVRSIETTRSFSRGWGFWSTGKITVVLDNTDGRFSPDNLDPTAPYVVSGITTIRPGVPIKASITYLGITYPIFYGDVTSWGEEWAEHAPRTGDALVRIEGNDVWGRLSKAQGVAISPVGGGDTYGQRINRILSAAGFSGSIDADPGYVTFQPTDLSTDRVEDLNDTAETEGGAVWAEADGSIVARDRYSLIEDLRSVTPVEVFGDGNPDFATCWLGSPWTCPDSGEDEVPWVTADVAPLTDDKIINRAVCTRFGGTAQIAQDLTSISLYGDRTNSELSSLMCETDAQALALAQWMVLAWKSPEARVDRLTFLPQCDMSRLLPKLLGLRIRDLIKVVIRPPTNYPLHEFVRYCHISGIAMSISNNALTISFDTESASAYRAYSLSRWDVGLWGASDNDPEGARWFI